MELKNHQLLENVEYYRMPDFNSEVIIISVAKKITKKIYVVEYPKKVKTTTGTDGVFMAQHDGDYMPLETPTFFSV